MPPCPALHCPSPTTPHLFYHTFFAIYTGDRVGARVWIAVFIGFMVVLLILRPDQAYFNAWALLPVVSAVLYAVAMIITRTHCRNDSPLVLSLSLNLAMLGFGIMVSATIWLWPDTASSTIGYPFLSGNWSEMHQQGWIAMGILVLASLFVSVGAAIAYQRGPASIVRTFGFAYVAFAALWGFILFQEIPGPVTMAGTVLIFIIGVFSTRC